MNNNLDNKYFIILNKDEIIFSCLNYENKISFTKKHTLINGLNNLLGELENFFIDNLIEFEKSLKDFIRKIYIIIDLESSLSVNLSIKYSHNLKKINYQKIYNLLNILKYQFNKSSNDQKVIHMIIRKILIDGREKSFSFINEKFENLILEVRIECIKNQIVHNIKKILSNYQISLEKILIANHLRASIKNEEENIVHLADKFIKEENINEILLTNKKLLKKGFFERFFDFFN
jgi:hypothetical protein